MTIKELLAEMIKRGGSDIFFRVGAKPAIRIDGKLVYLTTPEQRENFKETLDIDFAIFVSELDRRFRVSIFMQRNYPSIVIRNIRNSTETFDTLGLPTEVLQKLANEPRGLVLLTGSMGSGKSTTIASFIEYINANFQKHILTVEEPIEFTFKDKKSIINQRDLGIDVSSYAVALRSFTLQSPDVIYIGNIRDYETMSAAITAAETGVLVLSTLHTINAPQTVERIINFFPPHQHQQIRIQLSYLLKGVISLRLLPQKNGAGRIPAYETMLLTPTIGRLIREGKVWEIPEYIEDGSLFGMMSFNQCLAQLVETGKISEEDAAYFSDNREEFMLTLRGFKKK
jgi:twitching motility protein PilT